jgi:predicted adenylyl cyclase CyaB
MRNLEAKFRLIDGATAQKRAEAIGFVYQVNFAQRDTFFAIPAGKLKLREQDGAASLIYYQRDRRAQLELSRYEIVEVSNPAGLRAILGAALGIIAELVKRRTLLTRGNIRFHLDEVADLGAFGEIEVILPEADEAERHEPVVKEILAALKITETDLVYRSYFELIK